MERNGEENAPVPVEEPVELIPRPRGALGLEAVRHVLEGKPQEPRRQSRAHGAPFGVLLPPVDEQEPRLGQGRQEFSQEGLAFTRGSRRDGPPGRGDGGEVEQIGIIEEMRRGVALGELGPEQVPGVASPCTRDERGDTSPGAARRRQVQVIGIALKGKLTPGRAPQDARHDVHIRVREPERLEEQAFQQEFEPIQGVLGLGTQHQKGRQGIAQPHCPGIQQLRMTLRSNEWGLGNPDLGGSQTPGPQDVLQQPCQGARHLSERQFPRCSRGTTGQCAKVLQIPSSALFDDGQIR